MLPFLPWEGGAGLNSDIKRSGFLVAHFRGEKALLVLLGSSASKAPQRERLRYLLEY